MSQIEPSISDEKEESLNTNDKQMLTIFNKNYEIRELNKSCKVLSNKLMAQIKLTKDSEADNKYFRIIISKLQDDLRAEKVKFDIDTKHLYGQLIR